MKAGFRHCHSPSRQRGQAAPLAIVLFAAGAAAAYLAFNSSQLIHAKTKLQETADAAAYSVGVLQARDLNFIAYTNRAMIANQVAAAQMVSIKSWIAEVDKTYRNDYWFDYLIETVTPNESWTIPKRMFAPPIREAKRVLDLASKVATFGLDKMENVLSHEQMIYHQSMSLQIPLVAEAIAQANEPNTHITKTYFATRGALSIASTLKFVTKNEPLGKTEQDRFADVLTDKDTLDNFIRQRGLNVRTPIIPAGTVNGCSVSFVSIANFHNGGTQLRRDKRGWEALDATDVNGVWVCVLFNILPIALPVKWPAGSGGAANGPGGAYSDRTGYGQYQNYGGALSNLLTMWGGASQYRTGPGKSLSDDGGIKPYLELAKRPTAADGPDFNRAPTLVVEAQRRSASIATTDQLQIGAGELYFPESTASRQMRAMSSASAYFIRPGDGEGIAGALRNAKSWLRADKKWEYPSAFNPYWQSSLVATSIATVEAAAIAQAAGAP